MLVNFKSIAVTLVPDAAANVAHVVVVPDVAVGDPLDPATKVGALISEKHLGVVSGYVDLGQQEGATLRLAESWSVTGTCW